MSKLMGSYVIKVSSSKYDSDLGFSSEGDVGCGLE